MNSPMLRGTLRSLVIPTLPTLLLVAAGCDDPCFGVAACVGEPRISYEGQLVRHWGGHPVEGVAVRFARVGGVEVESDTFTVTTGVDGRFTLEVGAEEAGEVVADIEVTPPTRAAYVVPGMRFRTRDRRGDGDVLPRWVVDPYFPYVGELYFRPTGEPLRGARVELRRTGGTAVPVEVWEAETDQAGRFSILTHVYPPIPGEMEAELTVTLPAPYGRSVVPGIRLATTHVVDDETRVARWGVGPSLAYFGELFARADLRRLEGVEVEFRRTGGIPVQPEHFVVRTDAGGRFPFPVTPLASGELRGELTVRPAPPALPFTETVRVSTFDTDGGRLFGIWGVGPHLPYAGLVYLDGVAVEGVEVEFRRTGGIRIEPERFTTRSTSYGAFPLGAVPLEVGEVIGELTIRPPAPFEVLVVPDVRLATTEEDLVGVVIGNWNLPRP